MSSFILFDSTLKSSKGIHELRRYFFKVIGRLVFLQSIRIGCGTDPLQLEVHFTMEIRSPLIQEHVSTDWIFNMIVLKY